MKLTRLVAAAGLLVAAGIGGVVVATPASAYPDGVVGTATINSTVFAPGDTAVVTVENTTPGGLTMQIFSAPVTIGTGTTGADGKGSVSGAIPAGYKGVHTIQVTGAGGEIYPFTVTITSKTGPGKPSNTDDNGPGGLANTGAAVTGIGILGGILVAGGVFFVVAGRRRTTANQTPSV
ncbi:hypothetical protein ACXR2U_08590 [Jatrophihabitans sp. YIM 134969]